MRHRLDIIGKQETLLTGALSSRGLFNGVAIRLQRLPGRLILRHDHHRGLPTSMTEAYRGELVCAPPGSTLKLSLRVARVNDPSGASTASIDHEATNRRISPQLSGEG